MIRIKEVTKYTLVKEKKRKVKEGHSCYLALFVDFLSWQVAIGLELQMKLTNIRICLTSF